MVLSISVALREVSEDKEIMSEDQLMLTTNWMLSIVCGTRYFDLDQKNENKSIGCCYITEKIII